MPTFQLSHDVWVAREVERVKSILVTNMDPERVYTQDELLALCADYGLRYDNPEYEDIGRALVAEGFLEVVP